MKKIDIYIAGVGGQGVILASDILSETAMTTGYDVKKTDTIGMAQRGGSVVSHVRIGNEVHSPLIKEGGADMLLSLEKLEAVRWSHYLKPGGIALINNQSLPPLSVSLGNTRYPTNSEITDILQQHSDGIYMVDVSSIALALGNRRTVNIIMLGLASALLPFKISTWKLVIGNRLRSDLLPVNIAAFERGRSEYRRLVARTKAIN